MLSISVLKYGYPMWKYASVFWNTYLGISCTDVQTGLYPGQVKIGELVHKSQNQDGVWWGKFYNRTITPECSEDRTAVLSMVKTQSELCV